MKVPETFEGDLAAFRLENAPEDVKRHRVESHCSAAGRKPIYVRLFLDNIGCLLDFLEHIEVQTLNGHSVKLGCEYAADLNMQMHLNAPVWMNFAAEEHDPFAVYEVRIFIPGNLRTIQTDKSRLMGYRRTFCWRVSV